MKPPNLTKQMYQDWLTDSLYELEELGKDIAYWQSIYEKRVFQQGWPESIKQIIDNLYQEVGHTLENSKHCLKVLKDEISSAQSRKDEESSEGQGERPADTDKDFTGA